MCLCLGLAVVLASAAAITTTYLLTKGTNTFSKLFLVHKIARSLGSN